MAKTKKRDLSAWAQEADRELALVEAMYEAAIGGDVIAGKFLLANMWPKRWSISPHPTKPSPLDPPVEGATDEPAPAIPGAPPYRMKLYG